MGSFSAFGGVGVGSSLPIMSSRLSVSDNGVRICSSIPTWQTAWKGPLSDLVLDSVSTSLWLSHTQKESTMSDIGTPAPTVRR